MKNLFISGPTFIAVIVLMAWNSSVLAQEELGPMRGERTEQVEPSEPDNKTSLIKTSTTGNREHVRDSVAVKPVTQRKPDSKNETPQDDILSFNFLYYIIQRFKLSDIVD